MLDEQLTESIYIATKLASKERKISVNSVLKLLGVSSSGYYSWVKRPLSNQEKMKQKIKSEIVEIYNESHQIYGAPKITSIFQSRGHVIAEKTVGNYMREEGIKAILVRPYTRTTRDPDFDNKLKNILDRDFNPKGLNAFWVTDITYIYTISGFAYLTSVMDLFSRKIIGWQVSNSLYTEHVLKAIEKAKANRKLTQPVIIHSDRGVQYCSNEYQKLLKKRQITCSMSRKGNCYDNACAETFFSTIKCEMLYHKKYITREEVRRDIFWYIEIFYNRRRRHQALGNISPAEFKRRYYAEVAA